MDDEVSCAAVPSCVCPSNPICLSLSCTAVPDRLAVQATHFLHTSKVYNACMMKSVLAKHVEAGRRSYMPVVSRRSAR